MHARIRHLVFFDQLTLLIHLHVILVPKVNFLSLLRPPSIGVLLTQLRRLIFPLLRSLTLLDGFILRPTVAWPRNIDKRRIHNLALLSNQPLVLQILLKSFKELFHHTSLDQPLFKIPNRVLVWKSSWKDLR